MCGLFLLSDVYLLGCNILPTWNSLVMVKICSFYTHSRWCHCVRSLIHLQKPSLDTEQRLSKNWQLQKYLIPNLAIFTFSINEKHQRTLLSRWHVCAPVCIYVLMSMHKGQRSSSSSPVFFSFFFSLKTRSFTKPVVHGWLNWLSGAPVILLFLPPSTGSMTCPCMWHFTWAPVLDWVTSWLFLSSVRSVHNFIRRVRNVP